MEKIKAIIFDAYGTLFDVDAACRKLSVKVGEKWLELSTLWRLRQIEYTWLRNSMNQYINFWKITSDALEFSLETLKIENINIKNDLLLLYKKLETYPEVELVLENIKNNGFKTAILSNGTKEMLDSAVLNNGIKNLLDEILSSEECRVYKPSSEVYDLVESKMGVKKENVLFFSSNAWDMHAAANYGFRSVWINRFEAKLEKLPGEPEKVISSLKEVEKILEI